MKQIYPVSCSSITKVEENPITQQQYEDLVDRTNAVVECAKEANNALNCYKECQAKATVTCELTVDSANINSLTSSTINVENLNVGNLHQDNLDIACIGTECVYATTQVCTPSVVTEYLTADCINMTGVGDCAQIRNICSEKAELHHVVLDGHTCLCNCSLFCVYDRSCINVYGRDSGINIKSGASLCIPKAGRGEFQSVANLYRSNLTCTNIEEAEIGKETVVCSTVGTSNVDYLDAKFITHCNYKQVLCQPSLDAYVLLPLFTNGLYLLEGQNDTYKKLWSVEVLNSINNIEFRWSESKLGYIQDIKYGTDASGAAVVQIHVDPLMENVTIYEQSISQDNTIPPTIYLQDQLRDVTLDDGKSGIAINQLAGTYINNIIFTDKLHVQCLEMDSLLMDCVGVYRKLFLTCDFNKSGQLLEPKTTSGAADQYIANRIICNEVTPTWESPATEITTNNGCGDEKKLTTSNVVATYNGEYREACACHEEWACNGGGSWSSGGMYPVYTDWTIDRTYIEENWTKSETSDYFYYAPEGSYPSYYDAYWYELDGKYYKVAWINFETGNQRLGFWINETQTSSTSIPESILQIEGYWQKDVPSGEPLYMRDDEGEYHQIAYKKYYNGVTTYYLTDDTEWTGSDTRIYRKVVTYEYDYCHPIVHLGNATCVHGSIETECNSLVNNNETVCGDLTTCTSFTSPHIGDTCNINRGLQISSICQTTCCLGYGDEMEWGCLFESTPSFCYCPRGATRYEYSYFRLTDWACCNMMISDCWDMGCVSAFKKAGDWYPEYTPYMEVHYMEGYPGYPYSYSILYYDGDPSPSTCCAYLYNFAERCGSGYPLESYPTWRPIILSEETIETDVTLARKNGTRLDELASYNCECSWQAKDEGGEYVNDKAAIVYNPTSNTIQPTRDLKLDNLSTDNLTVNNDAVVKGDLYVQGVTHTVEEETVSTSSDMLVLRQNNNTTLASGEASGIIINKYDGSDSLAIVTDNTGTLRIGEPSGTDSVYEDAYYKNGHWYSDLEETTEITPAGELTGWDSKEITENGSTHYHNAKFTSFDYAQLSPVLGRDELANMTDNALLVFNCSTWEANTLTVPSTNGASLKYNTATCSYYWEKSAGVYHFATMASYEAASSEIPEDSVIVIDDQIDYTVSEDV